MACDDDVRLSADPHWLGGECWCAAREPLTVVEGRLDTWIEQIPGPVLDELRRFTAEGVTALPRGRPYLRDLGDPRVQLRQRWRKSVRDFAVERGRAVLRVWQEAGRGLLARFEEAGGALLARLKEAAAPWLPTPAALFMAPLAGVAGAAAAGFWGSAWQFLAGEGVRPHRFKLTPAGVPGFITLKLTSTGWLLALEVEAKTVRLEGGSGSSPVLECLGGSWVPAGMQPLPTGRYTVVLERSEGVVVFDLVLGVAA
jgi:hypothetical protein